MGEFLTTVLNPHGSDKTTSFIKRNRGVREVLNPHGSDKT